MKTPKFYKITTDHVTDDGVYVCYLPAIDAREAIAKTSVPYGIVAVEPVPEITQAIQ